MVRVGRLIDTTVITSGRPACAFRSAACLRANLVFATWQLTTAAMRGINVGIDAPFATIKKARGAGWCKSKVALLPYLRAQARGPPHHQQHARKLAHHFLRSARIPDERHRRHVNGSAGHEFPHQFTYLTEQPQGFVVGFGTGLLCCTAVIASVT